MNKKCFLKKLKRALNRLETSEKERYISFYDEIISDLIDGGLTETEAVEKQGNVEDIVKDIYEELEVDKVKDKSVLVTVLMTFAIIGTIFIIFAYIFSANVAAYNVVKEADSTAALVSPEIRIFKILYFLVIMIDVITIIVCILKKKSAIAFIPAVLLISFAVTVIVSNTKERYKTLVYSDSGNYVRELNDKEKQIKAITDEYITLMNKTNEIDYDEYVEKYENNISEAKEDDIWNDFSNNYVNPIYKDLYSEMYAGLMKGYTCMDWGEFVTYENIFIKEVSEDMIVVRVYVTYENISVNYMLVFNKELEIQSTTY